jgi:hypothetical protein
MYSKVKILRRNGERRPDREIASDPGIVGHISMCVIVNYTVLKIFAPGGTGGRAPLVPELFRAHCTTIEGARMLFRGFNRIGNQDDENAPVVRQEWAVEIMVEQPERIAQPTNRL